MCKLMIMKCPVIKCHKLGRHIPSASPTSAKECANGSFSHNGCHVEKTLVLVFILLLSRANILSKKRNAHVIQQEFFQVWSLYD